MHNKNCYTRFFFLFPVILLQNLFVHSLIAIRHLLDCESAQEFVAYRSPIQLAHTPYRTNALINGFECETGEAILDDLSEWENDGFNSVVPKA